MWGQLTNRVALGFAILAWSCAGVAQTTASNDDAISFQQAISMTLASNPELLAFGFQIEARRGYLAQSKLRPNPELNVELENFAGTGMFSDVNGTEATISLSWVLERGKRERRIDTALAGVSVLQSEAEIMRLDEAAATARLFLDSLAAQARLRETDKAIRLADSTVLAIKKRVTAGRAPSADLARAEVELSGLKLDYDNLQHELRRSLRRLAAQWGETTPGFSRVLGNASQLPKPDSFSDLLARVDKNPDVARYLSEQRLRQAKLRQEETEAKPNWQVTAGVRQLQQSSDQAFIAGITIPLSTRNKNQGRIAAARAELALSEANRTATEVQIETQLFSIYEALQHSLHRAEALREDILPGMERALAETERAYAAGRYSYFELRVAQADALAARAALTAAVIDAHRNALEIERLTGATLSSPTR